MEHNGSGPYPLLQPRCGGIVAACYKPTFYVSGPYGMCECPVFRPRQHLFISTYSAMHVPMEYSK